MDYCEDRSSYDCGCAERKEIESLRQQLSANDAENKSLWSRIGEISTAHTSTIEERDKLRQHVTLLRDALGMWLVSPQGERNLAMHEAERVKSTLNALAATEPKP